jgi:hypothetical protein
MSESLYTQARTAKFRGPTTSDDYNARVEELYKDLVYLYNKIGLADENVARFYKRILKDHFSLGKAVEDLKERIAALEADQRKITFNGLTQIDNDRFASTPYEIATVSQCTFDRVHGLMVLPRIETSSISKLKFTNSNGSVIVPSTFETLVNGLDGSADNDTAVIDTSDPYFAVINQAGKIWERNVIVNGAYGTGAQVTLYVRLPTDLSVVADSNSVIVHPYPVMGCELTEIAYSTSTDISLNDTDDYYPINRDGNHASNSAAVGWIAPGGWTGDTIENSGPKAFYFDPKSITALRIKLKQRNYFIEADKIIYSYGLAKLDVRYEKFLESGKTILRFDAPEGETISSVDDITPQIWNTSEAELDDIFSYRLIWETSYNSGVYTTTQPGSGAKRVWVEVTLGKTINKGTPALSGLIVSYS